MPFPDITKQDIIAYLNSRRRTESKNPSHKWIGTYNARQTALRKFFQMVV